MRFMDILNSLLTKNGISRNKFCADVEINKNSVANWENRGNVPDGEVLARIAEYFNVTVDYLLGQTNDPTSSKDLPSKYDELNELITAKDGAYLRLARGAKDLNLNEEDVDFLLEFLKRGRKQ